MGRSGPKPYDVRRIHGSPQARHKTFPQKTGMFPLQASSVAEEEIREEKIGHPSDSVGGTTH